MKLHKDDALLTSTSVHSSLSFSGSPRSPQKEPPPETPLSVRLRFRPAGSTGTGLADTPARIGRREEVEAEIEGLAFVPQAVEQTCHQAAGRGDAGGGYARPQNILYTGTGRRSEAEEGEEGEAVGFGWRRPGDKP